jgi:hypothetical protein
MTKHDLGVLKPGDKVRIKRGYQSAGSIATVKRILPFEALSVMYGPQTIIEITGCGTDREVPHRMLVRCKPQ